LEILCLEFNIIISVYPIPEVQVTSYSMPKHQKELPESEFAKIIGIR
jgi:hypothetical protein